MGGYRHMHVKSYKVSPFQREVKLGKGKKEETALTRVNIPPKPETVSSTSRLWIQMIGL